MPEQTSVPPTIDESARKRFEAAWVKGTPIPLDDVLPPPGDARFVATLEELIHIELEFGWKAVRDRAAARPASIEVYVARFPVLGQSAVLQRLMKQEYRVRSRYCEKPSTAEYAKRFPELTAPSELETASPGTPKSRADAAPLIAGYDVLGFLGAGGMGVVYEARDAKLGRVVALKTAHADLAAATGHGRERFFSEARIAAQLEHPGVVPVHDMLAGQDGEPCYSMKLVRGRTLKEAIEQYHASPQVSAVERRRLLEAFLTVVRTMAFVHSKGVIHRDLKPANVVLGEYGETVVLDWGLAKEVRSPVSEEPPTPVPPASSGASLQTPRAALTVPGDVLGTPAYMSPEQAAGRIDQIDERSDIYALGSILYQILTGRPPYTGESGSDVLRKIREEDPPRPRSLVPAVSKRLEAICFTALARRPEDRYPTAAELAKDVERYLAGEPVSAYPESAAERAARWARRHRTLVAVAAVALFLSFVGVAAGFYQQDVAERNRREQANKLASEHEADRERQRYETHQTLALAQQRQQIEDQHRDERERERREADERANKANEATEAEGIAIAELQAGRFYNGVQNFDRAAKKVRGVLGLEKIASRLEARLERARQITEFYRLKDRADRFAFDTSPAGSPTDAEVVRSCRAALVRLRVLDGPENWWDHLPGEDLLPAQRVRLEDDAKAVLTLLALWQLKFGLNPVLENPVRIFDSKIRAEFQLARKLAARLRACEVRSAAGVSSTTELLELFCAALLFDSKGLKPLVLKSRSPADAFFLGMAHFLLVDPNTGGAAVWVRDILKQVGSLRHLSGLDFSTPLATAERLFREAVAGDLGHYWAHCSVGYCQLYKRDWPAAEQVFNACVALRPTYVPAYILRCECLFKQRDQMLHNANRVREAAIGHGAGLRFGSGLAGPVMEAPASVGHTAALFQGRNDLMRRSKSGIERAPRAIRYDPYIRMTHYYCRLWLGEPNPYTTALSAVEMIVAQQAGGLESNPLDELVARQAKRDYTYWVRQSPTATELRGVLAVAHLANGERTVAEKEAAIILTAVPTDATARAVRGILYLRKGQHDDARKDFEASLAVRPNEIASVGKAMALERADDENKAIAAFTDLIPAGEDANSTSPLHLIAYLGRARVYAKIDDNEKAQAELQLAREIDPVAADALAVSLFGKPN